jgi:hypothetical protein
MRRRSSTSSSSGISTWKGRMSMAVSAVPLMRTSVLEGRGATTSSLRCRRQPDGQPVDRPGPPWQFAVSTRRMRPPKCRWRRAAFASGHWTVRVASRGLADRDADCPAGYLGLVVAGSRGRARSSWAREVMSQLGEDLAQVVLHRAHADEQPGADLLVRQALAGQPCDQGLLGGQLATGDDGAFAGGLAGGLQFAPGSLGEPLDAHRLQHGVGGTQLCPCVEASSLAAQPLFISSMRPESPEGPPKYRKNRPH